MEEKNTGREELEKMVIGEDVVEEETSELVTEANVDVAQDADSETSVEHAENDNLDALRKKSLIRRIIAIILILAILATLAVKAVLYILPEDPGYAKSSTPISEVNPDMDTLSVMPFNGQFTVASQGTLILNSNDKTAQVNFVSLESNKVLVRAEYFVDVEHLGNRPARLFWTNLLFPVEEEKKDKEQLVRIGDTGWVRAGEMVETLKFDEVPTCSGELKMRISAVNPANTKTSAGQFSANGELIVGDFNGKILDGEGNWVELETS